MRESGVSVRNRGPRAPRNFLNSNKRVHKSVCWEKKPEGGVGRGRNGSLLRWLAKRRVRVAWYTKSCRFDVAKAHILHHRRYVLLLFPSLPLPLSLFLSLSLSLSFSPRITSCEYYEMNLIIENSDRGRARLAISEAYRIDHTVSPVYAIDEKIRDCQSATRRIPPLGLYYGIIALALRANELCLRERHSRKAGSLNGWSNPSSATEAKPASETTNVPLFSQLGERDHARN